MRKTSNAVLLAFLAWIGCCPPGWAAEVAGEPPTVATAPGLLQVRLEDGGEMFAYLAQDVVAIETAYGTLRVPAEDVRCIQLRLRPSAEVSLQLQQAIAALASDRPGAAVSAADTLVRLGDVALPELRRVGRESSSLILVGRIRDVATKIFAEAGDRSVSIRDRDVVETASSRIRGRLLDSSLKIRTTQFGVLDLRLADARMLRSPAHPEPTPEEFEVDESDAQPDPGSLSNFAHQVGRKVIFRVTGMNGGSVWGTDVYTSDSQLSTAAVHAGVLENGETGLVLVEIVPALESYEGTSRNGVTTSNYGPYSGSYKVSRPARKVRFKLFSW